MATEFVLQTLREKGGETRREPLSETLTELFRKFFPGKEFDGVKTNEKGELVKRCLFFVLVASVITLGLLPAWDIHVTPESWRHAVDFRYGWRKQTEYRWWKRSTADDHKEIGLILKRHFSPQDSIALGAIGELGYYSGLYVYDRNSLVNRMTVEHSDGTLSMPGHDKQVESHWFLPMEPTIIKYEVIDGPPPDRINLEYPLQRHIRLRAEELQRWGRRSGVHVWRRYVPQVFPMSPDDNKSERVLMVLRLIEEEPHVKELPRGRAHRGSQGASH